MYEMLGYKIYDGSLTSQLLKPTSIFWLGVGEMVGRGVVVASILILLPYLVILPFLVPFMTVSTNWMSYIALIFLMPITFMIKYCIDFMVGSMAFWVVNNGGLNKFYTTIFTTLDGSAIPLGLVSKFLPFITWIPTAFVLYYPYKVYTDTGVSNLTNIFGLGFSWCIVLYFLAKLIFKLGLKRNEAVGL
jgi:ABC-2 type transport system permease protein